MIIKPCTPSKELLFFRSLRARLELSQKERQHHIKLEKGFEGEKKFNLLLENDPSDCLIVNDLLLEKNTTVFQIDTLLIAPKKIYHFEVKNFEGDYFIDNDTWYSASTNLDITNPISQLERSKSLLRKLLHDLGSSLPIESHLIFINAQFMLYHAPMNSSIIFPTQLDRFIKKLNLRSSIMNGSYNQLAHKLVAQHIPDYPIRCKPQYTYEGLQKGIICPACQSFLIKHGEKNLICENCVRVENWEVAVLRSVEELQLLFPNRKITTNGIYEWCGGIKSKKAIRRILMKYYILSGHANNSHFITKQENH